MGVMTDRPPLRAVMPAPNSCRIRKQPKRPKQHFVQFPEGFGDLFSAVGSSSGWEGGFAPGHASGVAPSLGAASRSGCVDRSAAAHPSPASGHARPAPNGEICWDQWIIPRLCGPASVTRVSS